MFNQQFVLSKNMLPVLKAPANPSHFNLWNSISLRQLFTPCYSSLMNLVIKVTLIRTGKHPQSGINMVHFIYRW